MEQQFSLETPARKLLFFALAMITMMLAMRARLGAEVVDDGAFFLRYAENMVNGEFWVWNRGEAPIWGASAPLYPLVIAFVMKLGVLPVPAMVGSSIAMGSVAFALVGLVLARKFGLTAGLTFIFLSALDSKAMYFSGAGLETPLTFLLLALGVWVLLERPQAWAVGLIAGLLMVNKLDLLPAGGLLLLAHWVQGRKFPVTAMTVAASVALVWYGFAWIYFGLPLPNSFLTKALYQGGNPSSLDWTWFGKIVLLGSHAPLAWLAVLATVSARRTLSPLVIFLGGTLAVHLIAYTVKYPFESYEWYAMPSVFALLVLAAIGVHTAAEWAASRLKNSTATIVRIGVPVLFVSATTLLYAKDELRITKAFKDFAAYQDHDRAEAGRWVAINTPKSFRVFTSWGHPAYYSQRYVYDGSYLNRKFKVDESVAKLNPEILILQNNPGSTPEMPVFASNMDKGYRIVKVFDGSRSVGLDYFFAVLARRDVANQVRNIEKPRSYIAQNDLMAYVVDTELGDKFGILKSNTRDSLFVHPGEKTPTRFLFDLQAFSEKTGQKVGLVSARIAPNVPEEAIERGAANVKVTLLSGHSVLRQSVVTAGAPMDIEIDAVRYPQLAVVIDNNGNPDTDWLIFSVR